jgi:iron complex outermembrane receptor protein
MTNKILNTPRTLRTAHKLMAAAIVGCLAQLAHADPQAPNFANLSLEELGNIEITSVSRKTEMLRDTPAPVYVIRGDEIRRAGAHTLPEALRLAPNLHVARVDARNYAVSARGFNNPFQNKMLVMIDGRTIYSPLFSGVFWDAHDLVMPDVDRIEVISGPGATIWGANAVNGVINIITKPADRTLGGLATGGAGGDSRFGSVRHGASAGNFSYRVYARYRQDDDLETENGGTSYTGMQRRAAGFRMDGNALGGELTVHGDIYRGELHQLGTRDIEIGGANLVGRLTRSLGNGSELRVQAYLDHTTRDQPGAFIEDLDTFDLDIQHSIRVGERHALIWGGGHRVARDDVRVNGVGFAFLPGRVDLKWTNVYAQDEIRINDRMRVTAGLKLEHNSYTGLETLPYLSFAFDAGEGHLLWASASRAVRAPSRIDRDLFAPAVAPVVNGVPQYAIAGGPDFQAEVARVAQLGYRGNPHAALSYAVTLFYSDYDRLRTLEPNPRGAGAVFLNMAEGTTYGAELSTTWDVRPDLRLTLGHVMHRLDLHAKPGSRDGSAATGFATNDPSSWSLLRASWDVSPSVELDLTARRVGALPRPVVPSYTAVDLRLGWELRDDLELSLLARNLFAGGHAEFGAPGVRPVMERSVLARLSWRF